MTFPAANDVSAASLLPFERNEFFIGREDQLRKLEQDLFDPNHHKRMTLYGLGGCGKSALALEFVYRALARDASLYVFWVPALSQESFELAYREIGRHLRIPGISEKNADIVTLVKEKLSSGSSGEWLMIVDNADDLSIMFGTTNGGPASVPLSDCVPYGNQGTVLFTTRSKDIAKILTPNSFLGLSDLSQPEARQLLARRVTQPSLLNNETAVDELLETLTYFPLAIVQAAAFLNNNRITVSEYRGHVRNPGSEAELFSRQFKDPSRYPDMDNTIATTWHISFNQIRKQRPLAAKYISFMACIDRFNIPLALLPSGGTPIQQAEAIGTLLGYAFITERQQMDQDSIGNRFFDMHRLVHLASIGWLNEHNERATCMAAAVARLQELIPAWGQMEKRELWSTYLPHAIYISGLADVGQITKGSLLDLVARCQASLGQYSVATATYQQALAIRYECLGRDHPDSLATMNALACVHNSLGKYKEAAELHERTLAQRKKVLGPNHEDTLISMNNLAVGLKLQGKYAEAETLYKQNLERQQAQFGLKHAGTLESMSNLAEILAIQGKYREAERLYSRTIGAQVAMYGEKHPTVLVTRYKSGKVDERVLDDLNGISEEKFRDVLKDQEDVLGPDHPDTLNTLHSIAALRARLGHPDEAEAAYRRIVAQREILLGPRHISTVTAKYDLARLLKEQRCWGDAATFFEEATEGFYYALGLDHPTYKTCSMEAIKVRGRDQQENGPPLSDEPFKYEPGEILPHIRTPMCNMDGHPLGNTEPWDPHLPPAIKSTTEKKPREKKLNMARSLVAKMGIRKLIH
jgi:tetratricopeptide (TPR) repeat protein